MVENKYLIFLIIQFQFLTCINAQIKENTNIINFDSGFSLYQDTIFVDIKGEMTHALKYHDKLYILFEQQNLKYGGYGKRWLYIFSNGQLEKILDCPQEMETTYLDFYAKYDSIILKPYMDEHYYQLDLKNYCWNKIDKTDDLIFEDEKFQVYSLDFGEWGGKTWFKDKKNGLEYVIETTNPLINRIDTIYYLTNPYEVLQITNPLKLKKCEDDITYENIETSKKYYSWYGAPIGFDIIYEDKTFNEFDNTFKPNIVSSFVLNGELLHIYKTSTATYIARVKNNAIETIQKIGENISFYSWYYSYRCKNLKGNNELLKFRTKKERLFGLMEIIDSKIVIHYFINKSELNPMIIGTKKADSLFVNRLNAILPDLNNLTLNKTDLKEKAWGSFDITPNHNIGIGDSWNPNKYIIDTCKSYLIKEDSFISNSIIYYATKETDLVRAIIIDWDDETNTLNVNSEKITKKIFERKLNLLINCIIQKAGKEIKREIKENYIEITWKTPTGLTIELERNKNYNSIRLVIYKNE